MAQNKAAEGITKYTRETMIEVEKKLGLLEEVVKVIKQFQHLTGTLESLVYASGAHNPLVDKAIEVLEGADVDHTTMTTDKIEFRLENLEFKIQDDLEFFIELVNDKLQNPASVDEAPLVLPERRIEEFRRRVKLALAYRVVLTERGEALAPFDLGIAVNDISHSLTKLRVQEKVQRKQLIGKMEDLQRDLKCYVQDARLSAELRELFADMLQGLIANIGHVNAGHPVEQMPMPVEDLDVAAAMAMSCQPDTPEQNSPSQSRSDQTPPARRKGFFNRLEVWLDSPMDVSWADTKSQDKKP